MMSFFSTFYEVEVRDDIAREFMDSAGQVDDMLAGLHEIRDRMAAEDPWLRQLHDQFAEQASQFGDNSTIYDDHNRQSQEKLTA